MRSNSRQTNKPPEESVDESTSEGQPRVRTATINTDKSGDPIGIAVWLNVDELIELGVDPDANDSIDVRVNDGEIELIPKQAKGSDSFNDGNHG